MILDEQTLSVAEGLVVTVVGVAFILGTVIGQTSALGRVWSSAFIAGILAVFSFAIATFGDALHTVNAVGNGAFVFALGAMWSGCRLANGRRSHIYVPLVTALIVAGFALIDDPAAGEWAGALALFIVTAISAAFVAIETLRGTLLRSAQATPLTIVFVIVALYYLTRATIIAIEGVGSPLFLGWFGSVPTSVLVIVFMIVAGLSMASIRDSATAVAAPSSRQQHTPGVSDTELFTEQLHDRLKRARIQRVPVLLVILEVKDLEHLNSVFGRDFGDTAISSVGRIACENSPVDAIVGRISTTRFAIATAPPAHGSPSVVVENLQTALVEHPVDTATGVRAIASFGVGSTMSAGYRDADLIAEAEASLTDAVIRDRNKMVVSKNE